MDLRLVINQPFAVTSNLVGSTYDVFGICGGGYAGQAGAIQLHARPSSQTQTSAIHWKPRRIFLHVDSRKVERKKPGLKSHITI